MKFNHIGEIRHTKGGMGFYVDDLMFKVDVFHPYTDGKGKETSARVKKRVEEVRQALIGVMETELDE